VYESPQTRHYINERLQRREKMAKEKHYIFSARTTEEELRQLGGLKAKLNVGWDDLVIDAVCAH
jgi:hypothetical protein